MVRPTPLDGAGAADLDDLADRLVAVVCRPSDVDRVRAAVDEAQPDDLAGLVAAVDQHQPMTLEVAVDVLAELGVPPEAVAPALAVDVEDVVAMLGGPLGDPPAPRVAADARIIEVVHPRVDEAAATADVDGEAGPPVEDTSPVGRAEPADDTVDGGTEQPGDALPVAVRVDEVAEDEAVARTVADLEDASDQRRSRWWWVLALVVVIAAAVVAALLAGWP
ncbi:hypothetical protein [Salsipaludibacter albus]|uniref:hypothetical protein n=1 Tax=Salsipaludibacter albus TaxID=2849650 RepID=UPI001EE47B19|nr:hypothetical protein [Salsipaludibacter albus]MBY5161113.1 hypothetical protein [Salsipaludibacter albus]